MYFGIKILPDVEVDVDDCLLTADARFGVGFGIPVVM